MKRLGVLFALFFLAAGVHAYLLPLMEGPDEMVHAAYVFHLRETGHLPSREDVADSCTRQSSGQPPLAYAASALAQVFGPVTDCDAAADYAASVLNPWRSLGVPWLRGDASRLYVRVDPGHTPPPEGLFSGLRAARGVSLMFGAAAVAGAYAVSRELFSSPRWQITMTAVFAFTPAFLHLTAYVNNDAAAVAFATWGLWAALNSLNQGVTVPRLLAIGVLYGLAGLSKISALLVVPGAVVALAYRSNTPRQLLRHLALAAVAGGVVLLPWMIYGWAVSGDPLGVTTHSGNILDRARSLTDVMRGLPQLMLTYFGAFGMGPIRMRPLMYAVLIALVAISLLGVSRPRPRHTALLVASGTMIAGFLYWYVTTANVGARLLLPGHIAFAGLVTAGLAGVGMRWPTLEKPLALIVTGSFVFSGFFAANLALYAEYWPRRGVPPLTGPPVNYDDTVRLLGLHQETNRAIGRSHGVTLCWEVLQATERRAAVNVQLVRDSDIAASRVVIPGMANLDSTRWRPGERFCDLVALPTADLSPATVYDVMVTLRDVKGENWPATVEFPVVGQVVRPAEGGLPVFETPLDVEIGDLAQIRGVNLAGDMQPGSAMQIEIGWDVSGTTMFDLSQFIHLVGPGEASVLADGTPRGGAYPTWAWAVDERFTDRWSVTLPDALPPGQYQFITGLYDRGTGARLPVAGSSDQTVTLASFEVR